MKKGRCSSRVGNTRQNWFSRFENPAHRGINIEQNLDAWLVGWLVGSWLVRLLMSAVVGLSEDC